ncbi:hypothetical protein ElyMa_005874700 [Elysia marginata]|uniref:Uncharacterized protein n=1 Tax=Elysia marginata TaxID=1093978 RepID=A0AAV4G4G4_9GAST|nr:hypothetical protein ElyMa_005874700 [Elysia marginata]
MTAFTIAGNLFASARRGFGSDIPELDAIPATAPPTAMECLPMVSNASGAMVERWRFPNLLRVLILLGPGVAGVFCHHPRVRLAPSPEIGGQDSSLGR